MKKYIAIENNGEIELSAFFIMGVTSKESDDNTIGQFGTGTKYGIAALMREGYDVTIFSGKNKVEFKTKKIQFRDQEHNKIMYRTKGQFKDAGITVEMGKLNWNAPRGFRELVSNAIDEGGFTISRTTEIAGEAGKTRMFIEYRDNMNKLDEDFDKYFLINRQPLFSGYGISLYKKHGSGVRIYRKGVLVFETNTYDSEYDYDLKHTTVNEDRTASGWAVRASLSSWMHEIPMEFMRKIAGRFSSENNFEAQMDSSWIKVNPEWKSLFPGAIITPDEYLIIQKYIGKITMPFTVVVPDVKRCMSELRLPTANDIIENSVLLGWEASECDEFEEQLLNDAVTFLRSNGIKIQRSDITVADNPGGALGQYVDGKIYINKESINKGLDDTIDTLFEEVSHRDSGYGDATLEFQDFLKKKCLYYMRRLSIQKGGA